MLRARAPSAELEAYRDLANELRLLVDSSPYCIHRIDAEGKVSSMNQAGLDMLGLQSEADVIGVPYLSAVGDADSARITDLMRRAFEGESSEFQFVGADGTHYKSCFVPLREVGGQVVELMGLSQDVTELENTIKELRQSELLNAQILQAVPCGVCHVSATGDILSANERALETLGMTKEALEASEVPDFEPKTVWEDGSPCPAEDYPVSRALVTGESQPPVVIGTQRPDGKLSWALYSALPLKDDTSGDVTGAVVTFVDITERKAREEERLLFEEGLLRAQKLESLGVLASGIAHDFNNLLVGVLGHSGLARRALSREEPAQKSIAQIEEAARRASELTRQMLAYAGEGRLELETIDLSKGIAKMRDFLAVSLPKGVAASYDLANELPAIEADRSQIEQVVMNLISNAAEAISGPGRVTVTTGRTRVTDESPAHDFENNAIAAGDYVHFAVRDDGQGIPQDTIPRIFDPFFSTKLSGRGLGLSAVLGIVRRHRGAIIIESELGVGTVFRALFPVHDAPASDVAAPREANRSPASGAHVLIIDDQAQVLDVAGKCLRSAGYRVTTAPDGTAGLERFTAQPDIYDVVLLDFAMPGLSGADVLAELRKIRPDLKVVLSSGYTRDHDATIFTDPGLSAVLQKPYSPEELIAVVDQALR